MDLDRFTSAKTGELVRITTPEGPDWAFVPSPLPTELFSPYEVVELLGEVRELLGELNGVCGSFVNPVLLLIPLQRREALRSSSLEGTHATAEELIQYEQEPESPSSNRDPRNEWREVHNYYRALVSGWKRMGDLPLSCRLIRETHQVLLDGVRGKDRRPGEFREIQVHLGSDRRYIPPPPDRVAPCMHELEQFLNDPDVRMIGLIKSFVVHYQFESIHPFHDGNGRVGRVLLALTAAHWHDHELPWLYMSAYFERYRDEYIERMFKVSAEGDWDGWLMFCLRGARIQCADAIRRCRELMEIRDAMHAEADALSPRMRLIVDKLFEYPAFTTRHVSDWCEVSMPTARADIDKLIEAGIVEESGNRRVKQYAVGKIMRAAFGELEA